MNVIHRFIHTVHSLTAAVNRIYPQLWMNQLWTSRDRGHGTLATRLGDTEEPTPGKGTKP